MIRMIKKIDSSFFDNFLSFFFFFLLAAPLLRLCTLTDNLSDCSLITDYRVYARHTIQFPLNLHTRRILYGMSFQMVTLALQVSVAPLAKRNTCRRIGHLPSYNYQAILSRLIIPLSRNTVL